MTERFEVKVAASPQDIDTQVALAVKESWLVAKCENELLYAADPNGSLIGMFEGEEVSYINLLTYGDKEHSFFSNLLVQPKYREQRKGLGLKIADVARSRIPKKAEATCVSATSGVGNMAMKYKQRYGFQPGWSDHFFKFNLEKIISLPFPSESSNVMVTSYKEAAFNKLFEYDTSVFGFTRKSFLKKLVEICDGWVAMDEKGDITGYCSVREAVANNCGWILGPWYANDVFIAQALLLSAARFVSAQPNVTHVLSCHIPEVNQESIKFARTICTEEPRSITRMFSPGGLDVIIKNTEKRVFAMTGPAFGG